MRSRYRAMSTRYRAVRSRYRAMSIVTEGCQLATGLLKNSDADLRTDTIEDADAALWFAGDADRAAVGDHEVREDDPVLFGDELLKVVLDLNRVGIYGEPQPL